MLNYVLINGHLTHSAQTLHSTKIADKRGISSAAQHEISSCINDAAKTIKRISSLKIITHFVFLATGALTNYKSQLIGKNEIIACCLNPHELGKSVPEKKNKPCTIIQLRLKCLFCRGT